jgi:hypothetical protein
MEVAGDEEEEVAGRWTTTSVRKTATAGKKGELFLTSLVPRSSPG